MRKFSAAIVVLLLIACATPASIEAQTSAPSPFIVTDPIFAYPWLDPHTAIAAELHRFWRLVYETPLDCDDTSPLLTLRPALLVAMPEISPDGLRLKMTFKKGIKYADHACFKGGYGREVKAADFLRVIQRHIDPATKSPFYASYLQGRIVGIDKVRQEAEAEGRINLLAPIPGIKIVDDYTVEIQFTESYALFIPLLSMPWMSIMPDEAMQRYGTSMSEIMVGTGPYVQDREASSPTRLTFRPNTAYWANEGAAVQLPRNDGVRLEVVDKLDLQENRFIAGDVNVMDLWPLNVANFVTMNGRLRGTVKPPRSTIVKTDLTRLHYIAFNATNKILGKKEVRQAIALATNRQWYMETYYKGAATLADHICPPSLPFSVLGQPMPWAYGKHDIAKARELMAKAGHAYGRDLPEFILESSADDELSRAELDFLKKSWSTIGIRVQTRVQTFAQLIERSRQGLHEISVNHWYADYPDAENFFMMLESGRIPQKGVNVDAPNVGHWKNADYDRLYRESYILPPGRKRSEIFEKMVAIVQDECPWLFVAHQARFTVAAPGIKGITTRSTYAGNYATIYR